MSALRCWNLRSGYWCVSLFVVCGGHVFRVWLIRLRELSIWSFSGSSRQGKLHRVCGWNRPEFPWPSGLRRLQERSVCRSNRSLILLHVCCWKLQLFGSLGTMRVLPFGQGFLGRSVYVLLLSVWVLREFEWPQHLQPLQRGHLRGKQWLRELHVLRIGQGPERCRPSWLREL